MIGNESEYVRISKEKHEPRDDEIGKPDALGHERWLAQKYGQNDWYFNNKYEFIV